MSTLNYTFELARQHLYIHKYRNKNNSFYKIFDVILFTLRDLRGRIRRNHSALLLLFFIYDHKQKEKYIKPR